MTSPTNAPARRSVLFLIPSLAPGGAERQLIGLAGGLHRAGWQVRVLTFHDGGAFAGDLEAQGVGVETVRRRGRWDVLGFTVRLARSVRRQRPDVLHSYLPAANIAAVILKLLAPRLRVVWGVRASDMNLAHYGRRASLIFDVSCRLARFADLIIYNSTSGLEFHVARGYPRKRSVMIPNGIDSDAFAPDPTARRAARAELGIGADDILIGLVARLDPMKDHPTFLRAAQLVANRRPDVTFACVGDGPPGVRQDLERLSSDLGLADRVIWTGGRNDLRTVYNAFDLVVSSSLSEALSNVVAEAMATGVPAVVTDVGDSAFLVGDAGWVCRPGDPPKLAEAMLSAVASGPELDRRGALARQRISTVFSLTRRDRTTADALMTVISGTRPAPG